MKNDIEHIREFVTHGSDRLFTRKKLKFFSALLVPINIINLLINLNSDGAKSVVGLTAAVLWIVLTVLIYLPFKGKNDQTGLYFLFNGLFYLSLYLAIFSIIFSVISTMNSDIITLLFVIINLLSLIAFFALAIGKIRSDYYTENNKKQKNEDKQKVKPYFAISISMLVYFFLNRISDYISKYITEDIKSIISILYYSFILIVLSLGIIDFVKYYYVKKYKIKIEWMTDFYKDYYY